MKEAIGYTIFRSLFPGRTHCKDLQKDSGGLLWKEAWQTQGFLLARKVLTLVTSLSEGNKDNALLPAISSIQWQNYVPISLGQVCGAGLDFQFTGQCSTDMGTRRLLQAFQLLSHSWVSAGLLLSPG